jgi:hypothetical protein
MVHTPYTAMAVGLGDGTTGMDERPTGKYLGYVTVILYLFEEHQGSLEFGGGTLRAGTEPLRERFILLLDYAPLLEESSSKGGGTDGATWHRLTSLLRLVRGYGGPWIRL